MKCGRSHGDTKLGDLPAPPNYPRVYPKYALKGSIKGYLGGPGRLGLWGFAYLEVHELDL